MKPSDRILELIAERRTTSEGEPLIWFQTSLIAYLDEQHAAGQVPVAAVGALAPLIWTSNGQAGDGQNVCVHCDEQSDGPHELTVCIDNLRRDRDALHGEIGRLQFPEAAPVAASPAQPAAVDASACYCSDRMSAGVPCLPGRCPNVPAGPVAGELVTAQHRQLAARLHYAPNTWKHRQVLRWVETGEWNAGIGDSMPRVAAAIAGAIGEALKANRVEVEPVNVYLGGMLPAEAAEPATKGKDCAVQGDRGAISSGADSVAADSGPDGADGSGLAEPAVPVAGELGIFSASRALAQLMNDFVCRAHSFTPGREKAEKRAVVIRAALSQVETLQAGKREAERVVAELKVELIGYVEQLAAMRGLLPENAQLEERVEALTKETEAVRDALLAADWDVAPTPQEAVVKLIAEVQALRKQIAAHEEICSGADDDEPGEVDRLNPYKRQWIKHISTRYALAAEKERAERLEARVKELRAYSFTFRKSKRDERVCANCEEPRHGHYSGPGAEPGVVYCSKYDVPQVAPPSVATLEPKQPTERLTTREAVDRFLGSAEATHENVATGERATVSPYCVTPEELKWTRPEPPGERVAFVINGEDLSVDVHSTETVTLTEIVEFALRESRNTSRPFTDWEVRTVQGQLVRDLRVTVAKADLPQPLFLTLPIGVGA